MMGIQDISHFQPNLLQIINLVQTVRNMDEYEIMKDTEHITNSYYKIIDYV